MHNYVEYFGKNLITMIDFAHVRLEGDGHRYVSEYVRMCLSAIVEDTLNQLFNAPQYVGKD